MSLMLAKKKDKAVQKKVQSLLRSKANKKCFDCPAKNPTFVNTNLQTFICSRCACLVREIGFRARLASSGKFTGAEVVELQYGGNEIARKIWLSSYVADENEPNDDEHVRSFMVQKYFEKKWLDNVLFESHQQKIKERISKSYNEDGLPIETKYRSKVDGGFSRLRLLEDDDQDFEVNNQIEEDIIEDLTPEATKSNTSTPSASKFTLNPSKFFSSFSLTRRSSKNKNQEEEKEKENTPPTSPVSMTVTSTEENEDIGFVSPMPSPSNSTNSVQFIEKPVFTSPTTIKPITEPVVMMAAPPPMRKFTVEKNEQKVATVANTIAPSPPMNAVSDTILLSMNDEEENTQNYNQTRYSEELPQSKVNYSNIIQPVPPAKCAKFSAPPIVARTNNNAFSNIISELSGLHLEKSIGNVAYSGSVLSPTSVYQPMNPMPSAMNKKEQVKQEKPLLDFLSFSSQNQAPKENDVYQAIRSIPQMMPPPQLMSQDASSSEDEEDPWQEFCSSSSVDEEPWQEFCSASSVDENSVDENIAIEAEVNKTGFEKPSSFPVVVNMFQDLDPFAVSRRF